MERKFDLVTVANAVCVAAYVAIALGVALCDLGIPRETIRAAAVIGVVLLAALLAVDFLGSKPGNAR
jgi:hypothetical protein